MKFLGGGQDRRQGCWFPETVFEGPEQDRQRIGLVVVGGREAERGPSLNPRRCSPRAPPRGDRANGQRPQNSAVIIGSAAGWVGGTCCGAGGGTGAAVVFAGTVVPPCQTSLGSTGLTNVTATYDLREDGTVGVLNRGFNREKCRWKEADGTAEFQGEKTVASLSVTFFWPFAGGYHVFALDQQNYGYALVAGPSLDYLWILARRPDLPVEIRNELVGKARERGFPADDLILVDHSPEVCSYAK